MLVVDVLDWLVGWVCWIGFVFLIVGELVLCDGIWCDILVWIGNRCLVYLMFDVIYWCLYLD